MGWGPWLGLGAPDRVGGGLLPRSEPEMLCVPGRLEAAVCSGLHSEAPLTGCLATIVHLIATDFENKNQFPP